jgi:hypothetical protein
MIGETNMSSTLLHLIIKSQYSKADVYGSIVKMVIRSQFM